MRGGDDAGGGDAPLARPAHLQTALWFHTAEPLDAFVTTDTALAQAARELGLPA